jgi:hypothetical protein
MEEGLNYDIMKEYDYKFKGQRWNASQGEKRQGR